VIEAAASQGQVKVKLSHDRKTGKIRPECPFFGRHARPGVSLVTFPVTPFWGIVATQVLGYGLGAYRLSWAVCGAIWGLWGLLTDCATETILNRSAA
jgi:hypothetical protein